MVMADTEEKYRAHFCPGCRSRVSPGADTCPQCDRHRPDRGWPADPFIGRLVDKKYRIESQLGEGGFAKVFLARQVQGDIDLGHVVLKFLHQDMASNDSIRRRFINEARAARKLGSPHVVKMFDLGFDGEGLPYQVMEYLHGDSLDKILSREKTLEPQRAFRIGLQVAGALEECHENGIVHRDLKPDNLVLLSGRSREFIKVIDFGIARVPSEDGKVTHTMMGTPRYMPPEQILQDKIDGGVDIFALGVILFECLAGRPPIESKTPMGYLQQNLNIVPTPLRQVCADMPAELEALLARMMAKDRLDRPPSMTDVEARLNVIGMQQGWVPRTSGPMDVEGATASFGATEKDAPKTEPDIGEESTITAPEEVIKQAMTPPPSRGASEKEPTEAAEQPSKITNVMGIDEVLCDDGEEQEDHPEDDSRSLADRPEDSILSTGADTAAVAKAMGLSSSNKLVAAGIVLLLCLAVAGYVAFGNGSKSTPVHTEATTEEPKSTPAAPAPAPVNTKALPVPTTSPDTRVADAFPAPAPDVRKTTKKAVTNKTPRKPRRPPKPRRPSKAREDTDNVTVPGL